MVVKKEKGKNYVIKQDRTVTVIEYDISGDIEMQDSLNGSNNFGNIRKIDKYRYEVIDIGEIRFYNLNANKKKDGLRRSMKKLNQILKNNFVGAENELFITLTTKREVTEIRQIKKMFQQWWRVMKKKYLDLEFVAVYEMQTSRNSWHIHTIVKATEHKELKIPNSFIEEIWGYGYTKTSRITSMIKFNEINEEYRMVYKDNVTEKFGIDKVINYMCKIKTKEQIPTGERCYDTSKGIKRPKVVRKKYGDSRNQMGQDYKLKKEYTSIIINPETNAILNKVKKEVWIKDEKT